MELAGLLATVAVLIAATVYGLWRRRTDGRLRPEHHRVPSSAVAAPMPGDDPPDRAHRVDAELLSELGVELGVVTLLQFSTAFCAPCRATRRVCSEVIAMVPDVRHVEVDAESHLDAVRALHIWRTPTVLVLDEQGAVVRRATGVPTKAQVIAVVGGLLARNA